VLVVRGPFGVYDLEVDEPNDSFFEACLDNRGLKPYSSDTAVFVLGRSSCAS
jgi:hypothetical protein